jgi:hypothetical protein
MKSPWLKSTTGATSFAISKARLKSWMNQRVDTFAERLERAIQRSDRAKLIEARAEPSD